MLGLEPDLVVFDIHLPHLNGLDALRQIYQERVVAAVAITADRDLDLLRRALEEHVLAYLVKPIESHQLGPALLIAWAQFEELRELTVENATLRQTLQNRKTIERAKGVLMKRHRWSEAEAFRRLQKGAMNRRTSMIQPGAGGPEWPGGRALAAYARSTANHDGESFHHRSSSSLRSNRSGDPAHPSQDLLVAGPAAGAATAGATGRHPLLRPGIAAPPRSAAGNP